MAWRSRGIKSRSKQDGSSESSSKETQLELANCCLIGRDGVKTGQGVIVRGGKWVEDVGGPSNCRFVLITSHRVIPDSEKAAEDWLRIALGDKQYKVKIASCISCCGKDGILSRRSHADVSECPYRCNFTFAFLEDSFAVILEQVRNIYFPHVRSCSGLKEVNADWKAITTGRSSVYRCVRLKNGSTHECQISLQCQQTAVSSEKDLPQTAAVIVEPQSSPLRHSPLSSQTPFLSSQTSPLSSQTPPLSSQTSPLSFQSYNLLEHIRAYEQACFFEHSSDSSVAEGAPVYTMPQKGKVKMTKSLHSINSGPAAVAVSHMINLATIKNGIVRLSDPYPYLYLLLSLVTSHCEIMSDCYKNACSQVVTFINDSQDIHLLDTQFFATKALQDLMESLMCMIHELMTRKCFQLVDSNTQEVLESYLDLLVHVLSVLKEKNELLQVDKVVKLQSKLLDEMLKPEDLKGANEKIVRRCMEVLCLLTKLFNGKRRMHDENIRLLHFILKTHTSIADTQTSILESTALDEIGFLFAHSNLWNLLKAQMKKEEQLEDDFKSLEEKNKKLEVRVARTSQNSMELQHPNEELHSEQDDQLTWQKHETECQQLQEQLELSQERIDGLHEEKKEELQHLQEELNSTTAAYQIQVDELTQERNMLQDQLKQYTKEMNALEEELREAEKAKRDMLYGFEDAQRTFEIEKTEAIRAKEEAELRCKNVELTKAALVNENEVLKKERATHISDHAMVQESVASKNPTLKYSEEESEDAQEDTALIKQRLAEYGGETPEVCQVFSLPSQGSTARQNWIFGRDEVHITEEIVGYGGWGQVRVARLRGLNIAAKTLHEDISSTHNRSLFMREISIVASVRHPNLLLFLGAIIDGEPKVILTELLPTTLRKQMKTSIFPPATIQSIAHDVSLALCYLHQCPMPIIHRDVSSANVMLDIVGNGWKAKLGDFGSANLARYSFTVVPGSQVYAAPEAKIEAKQSVKMDVFSFGVLIIEMCIREFPLDDLLQSSRSISWRELAVLVCQCIASEPENRPTMVWIESELESLTPPN